jgi:hypothetical protein
MEEELQSQVLEASISNPDDPFETTIVGDAVSVGITTPLFKSGKRIKWTPEQLKMYASSLEDMPITLKFEDEEGNKLADHSDVIVGRIKEAYFDEAKNKVSYVGRIWKHYFPKSIDRLAEMMASDKKPETSWEFTPTGLEAVPDEGEDVFTPTGGRFSGLAVINKGADQGNNVALLAAAAQEEQQKLVDKEMSQPKVGTFEWISDKIAEKLSASGSVDTYKPATILETYPDHVIYFVTGKHFKLPYTIEGNDIEFSDTIEVEPIYQPLGASAAGSTKEHPEATPPPKVEENNKKTMAEIEDKELDALRASAQKATDLETETADLKKELDALKASNTELEDYKKTTEAEKAAAALETLAASRLAEVEKITPYKDATQKEEDKEAFKTMDEKSFEIIKRTLSAAAEVKGGVSSESRIEAPESREDEDGKARDILESDDFKALLASVKGESTNKEDK